MYSPRPFTQSNMNCDGGLHVVQIECLKLSTARIAGKDFHITHLLAKSHFHHYVLFHYLKRNSSTPMTWKQQNNQLQKQHFTIHII